MTIREFTHEEIGQEVEAVSGHYKAEREMRLEVGGREVLGIIGIAIWDRSCSGMGGRRYAIVPGYIVGYKTKKNDKGRPVSEVEAVLDEETQKEITGLIRLEEFVQQVDFW